MSSYTPEMLALRWHCTARHIRKLITSGRLAHFRVGGKLLRISEQAVERFEAGACEIPTSLAAIEGSGASTGGRTAVQDAIRSIHGTAPRPSGNTPQS